MTDRLHRLSERARGLLSSPQAPAIAAACGALLSLPTVVQGMLLDDHLLDAAARHGELASGYDLLRGPVAGLREQGSLGWWASDALQLSFMRPLAALSHALDFALWPGALWVMHLDNVLLYSVLILVVGRVLRRLCGPGPIVGLACLMFAIDELHALTVMWISARNTLMAALFGVLALAAHMRWRAPDVAGARQRSWVDAVLAALCFALALGSAEFGVSSLGYLAAYALVHERGLGRALGSLLPYLVITVAWRLAYSLLGYGAVGSDLYLDPSQQPLEILSSALVQTPALAFFALSLPITEAFTELTSPGWLLAPALGFVALAWVLAPLRDDPRARVLGLGMILAALPLATTAPSSRTLLLVSLGSAGLVALAWEQRRTPAFARRGRALGLRALLACQLVLAPILFVPLSFSALIVEGWHRTLAAEVPVSERTVVVLNVPGEISALYPQAMRAGTDRPWPAHCYLLYAGQGSIEAERVDAHTLELRQAQGWAAGRLDRLSRAWSLHGFEPGDRVELERASIEILDVTPDGRPTWVRARFVDDVDELTVLGFDKTALVRWAPEIGARSVWTAPMLAGLDG